MSLSSSSISIHNIIFGSIRWNVIKKIYIHFSPLYTYQYFHFILNRAWIAVVVVWLGTFSWEKSCLLLYSFFLYIWILMYEYGWEQENMTKWQNMYGMGISWIFTSFTCSFVWLTYTSIKQLDIPVLPKIKTWWKFCMSYHHQ